MKLFTKKETFIEGEMGSLKVTSIYFLKIRLFTEVLTFNYDQQ